MQRVLAALLLCFSVFALSACADIKDVFGAGAEPIVVGPIVESDPRLVSICLITDEFAPNAESRVLEVLGAASERFDVFGLSFYVAAIEAHTFAQDLLPVTAYRWEREIERVHGVHCDITMTVTNENYVGDEHDFAGRLYRSGDFFWILVDQFSSERFSELTETFQHELGHAFGAVHVDDTDSVMYFSTRGGSEWDKKNFDIIMRNRDRFK